MQLSADLSERRACYTFHLHHSPVDPLTVNLLLTIHSSQASGISRLVRLTHWIVSPNTFCPAKPPAGQQPAASLIILVETCVDI